VSLHDSLCGPDPAYFATTLTGGAKKHGEQNSAQDPQMHYDIVDKQNPILKDWGDLNFPDEAFFLMTWAKAPAIHPLATVAIAGNGPHKGEVVPQMWTYEHTLPGGKPARAFVWMQGHTYTNFANPPVEKTLLRGIAWAGNRPVEEVFTPERPFFSCPTGAPRLISAPTSPGVPVAITPWRSIPPMNGRLKSVEISCGVIVGSVSRTLQSTTWPDNPSLRCNPHDMLRGSLHAKS